MFVRINEIKGCITIVLAKHKKSRFQSDFFVEHTGLEPATF